MDSNPPVPTVVICCASVRFRYLNFILSTLAKLIEHSAGVLKSPGLIPGVLKDPSSIPDEEEFFSLKFLLKRK